MPRDDDLAFNLSQARNQIQDVETHLETSSKSRFIGLDGVNLYETLFAFTLLNFFSFLFFVSGFSRKPNGPIIFQSF
jgi:hypothetical protein